VQVYQGKAQLSRQNPLAGRGFHEVGKGDFLIETERGERIADTSSRGLQKGEYADVTASSGKALSWEEHRGKKGGTKWRGPPKKGHPGQGAIGKCRNHHGDAAQRERLNRKKSRNPNLLGG